MMFQLLAVAVTSFHLVDWLGSIPRTDQQWPAVINPFYPKGVPIDE